MYLFSERNILINIQQVLISNLERRHQSLLSILLLSPGCVHKRQDKLRGGSDFCHGHRDEESGEFVIEAGALLLTDWRVLP